MRKSVTFIIVGLFFIWILPLGVFIKPEKAKKACNGQRAICLCSHLIAKKMVKRGAKILVKNATSSNKEANGPGGASHYFILGLANQKNILQDIFLLKNENYLYSSLFYKSIEHIPKV